MTSFSDEMLQESLASAGGHVEMIPVAFDGHFGALHRPAASSRRGAAVVVCPPVGRDGRCAYRALFMWAEMLAGRGFQVLRYDHRGDGDSMALAPEADQWASWVLGVEQAAQFARAHTGAGRLVLAGLRIGATLAVAAAHQVRPDGLVLFAPFATGEAWLKELTWAAQLQKAAAARQGGAMEVEGLRLSSATVETLRKVDLSRTTEPTWRAAFVASHGSTADLALGPKDTRIRFQGYAKLFKDAHMNEAPTQVFEAASEWLERLAADCPMARTAPKPRARLATADWIEEPVVFGGGTRGVLTLPQRLANSQAVMLGNTASDPRAGVGGFGAYVARALATAGVAALRFDFRGMGESAPNDLWRTHEYEASRVEEFHQAAAVLAKHGRPDVVPIGLCTGGYHAIRSVIETGEFRRALAINAWLIFRAGSPLGLKEYAAWVRATQTPSIFHPDRWSNGKFDPRKAIAAMALLLRQKLTGVHPDPACRAVREEIKRAISPDTKIHLVYGKGDPALPSLEADFGPRGDWLVKTRAFSLSVVDGMDHALFSVESQDRALLEIFKFLGLDTELLSEASSLRNRLAG